jgi:hypothetical protein
MIDEAELVATGKYNDFGEEYFLLRENERLAYINRNETWLRVRFDGTASRSRTSNYKESDPYRQVWNDMKDEESELLERTKNGILFTPGYGDMARRYMSTARYYLRLARKQDNATMASGFFDEALKYNRLAKFALEKYLYITAVSR